MVSSSRKSFSGVLSCFGELSDFLCSPSKLKGIDTGALLNFGEQLTPVPDIEPNQELEDRRRRELLIRRLANPPAEHFKEDPCKLTESESDTDSTQSFESDRSAGTGIDLRAKGPNDFRINYLRKLSYSKVWVPQTQRPPRHQTLLIFDWDDTLLPTTFLNSQGDQKLPAVVTQKLRKTASQVKELLTTASQLGQVFIITNAMSGWVEYSAAKWMPELLPVLQNMRIISARSKYEPKYPGDVDQWKLNAFLDIQKQLNLEVVTNLLSMGDSNFEMDAVHAMGTAFSRPLIKTIKLKQSPTPDELVKQLDLIVPKFQTIVNTGRNLKIQCEKGVGAVKQ